MNPPHTKKKNLRAVCTSCASLSANKIHVQAPASGSSGIQILANATRVRAYTRTCDCIILLSLLEAWPETMSVLNSFKWTVVTHLCLVEKRGKKSTLQIITILFHQQVIDQKTKKQKLNPYLYIWPRVFPANSLTPAVAFVFMDSISSFYMLSCLLKITLLPQRHVTAQDGRL